MPTWPADTRDALDAFYGRHALTAYGRPTAAWEKAHLTVIALPYRMVPSWEPQTTITRLQCHRRVAESLRRVLRGILDHYGSEDAVRGARMHLYGGAYNYRRIAGAANLSVHAWGAALDLDPAHNPLGKRWAPDAGMMPEPVVALFEAEGWRWGGRFAGRPDCMHFQATA